MAACQTRLDRAAITLPALGLVEACPARRAASLRGTARTRRYDTMSLTVYALHGPSCRLLLAPFEWLSRRRGMALAGMELADDGVSPLAAQQCRASLADDLAVLAYVIAVVAAWGALLWLWERVGYVGSLEWALSRRRAPSRPASYGAAAVADAEDDWATHVGTLVQARSFCWLPHVLWTVAFPTLVGVDGAEERARLSPWTHPLLAPRPKLFPLLFAWFYALPCAAWLVLLLAQRTRGQAGTV